MSDSSTNAAKWRKLSRDAANTGSLLTRNQIYEIHRAEQLFEQRQNPGASTECAYLCNGIVQSAKQPSEAVMAKAHAMLAVDGAGPWEESERLDHARKAVQFWTVVVERTGSSRFDVEEARERLRDAQQMLRQMASSMSQT